MIYGSPSGLTPKSNVNPADQLWHVNAAGIEEDAKSGDRFGFALAAGQLGRGGPADLVVSVPGKDLADIADAGAAYAFYGRDPHGLSADVSLAPGLRGHRRRRRGERSLRRRRAGAVSPARFVGGSLRVATTADALHLATMVSGLPVLRWFFPTLRIPWAAISKAHAFEAAGWFAPPSEPGTMLQVAYDPTYTGKFIELEIGDPTVFLQLLAGILGEGLLRLSSIRGA